MNFDQESKPEDFFFLGGGGGVGGGGGGIGEEGRIPTETKKQ